MNIMVPINDVRFLDNYINAGADEFYLGFDDKKWFELFGENSDINRMSGFKSSANQKSFADALGLINKIKKHNKKAFVTFNANYYTNNQLDYIKNNYFPALKSVNLDGVIVSTPILGTLALKYCLIPIASTMCTIYNTDILEYYYKIGFRRIILPRDISLKEMKIICSHNTDIEYEAFFMRNGCVFSDGYCLGTHKKGYGGICSLLRSSSKKLITSSNNFKTKHDTELNDYIYNNMFHRTACGMCALYQMKEIGINSLKIVGRADDVNSICEDIQLTKKNMDIVKKSKCEEDYLLHMIYPSNSYNMCKLGLSCYYPEVRFQT